MKLLLDTHIWIWTVIERDRISAAVLHELEDVGNELWISPISVWEALMLHGKKRIWLSADPFKWVGEAASFVREAPLTVEIAIAAHQLAFDHPDPADRFLAATAGVLDLTLVTADQRLLGLGSIATLVNR